MSEADKEYITIETPIGECKVPFDSEKIKAFVQEVAHNAENRRTLFNEEVADFLGVEMGEEDEEWEWWRKTMFPLFFTTLNASLSVNIRMQKS